MTYRPEALAASIGALALGSLMFHALTVETSRSASAHDLVPIVVVTIVAVACALARAPRTLAVGACALLVALGGGAVATAAPAWWDRAPQSARLRAIQRHLVPGDAPSLAQLQPVPSVAAPRDPPAHVETSVMDLCYAENCYHESQRAVPLEDVAKIVTWAFADGGTTDAARKLGIRTIAYLDPSIQYDPKRDYSPLANDDESTMLHGCNGSRSTVRLGDLDGTLMDLGSPHYRALLRAHVDRAIRPHYDALFADDVFAAVESWLHVANPPCNHDFATERAATFGAWSAVGMPIVFNGLGGAPDNGQTNAHEVSALKGPNIVGAMYEMCLTAPNDDTDHTMAHKRVDDAWRSIENSHLAAIAMQRRFFCFSESSTDGASNAGQDERRYVYASHLLVYNSAYSVLQMALRSASKRVPVFPETRLVALDPVVAAPPDVDVLRHPGGAYVREYRRCFFSRTPLGPCAALVNPSSTKTAQNPLHGYHRKLMLVGGAIPDGGSVRFDATVPDVLPPAAGTILLR